jgi:hypothetical protein
MAHRSERDWREMVEWKLASRGLQAIADGMQRRASSGDEANPGTMQSVRHMQRCSLLMQAMQQRPAQVWAMEIKPRESGATKAKKEPGPRATAEVAHAMSQDQRERARAEDKELKEIERVRERVSKAKRAMREGKMEKEAI